MKPRNVSKQSSKNNNGSVEQQNGSGEKETNGGCMKIITIHFINQEFINIVQATS